MLFGGRSELDKHQKKYTQITLAQFQQKYDIAHADIIGNGTYGEVFKVQNSHGIEVAIKHFNKNAMRQAKQIFSQVDNLKLLDHPNIARFNDCYLVDKTDYYVVMEYCPLGSLASYLKKKDLDESEKIQICLEIASGLAFAHEKRIIHRDLKPDNILISKKGVAKLCDFGCSCLLDKDQNLMETQVGSPIFQDRNFEENKSYDQSIDIYSLGIIFYTIFKGEGIFDNVQDKQQLYQMRKNIDMNYQPNMRQFLKGVPEIISDIIISCMHPQTTKRYTAKQIVDILKPEIAKIATKSSSKISKLMSTIENEDFEDDPSLFMAKLIAYYKKVESVKNTFGSRKVLLKLLYTTSQQINLIQLLSTLKYVEPKTKEQFMVLVIIYYYYWLTFIREFLNKTSSHFNGRYPEIVLSAVEPEVMSTAFQHISAQFEKYEKCLLLCSKNASRRLRLVDSKTYVPETLKKWTGKLSMGLQIDYDEIDQDQLLEELTRFYQKRIIAEYNRTKGNKNDPDSDQKLQKIKALTADL